MNLCSNCVNEPQNDRKNLTVSSNIVILYLRDKRKKHKKRRKKMRIETAKRYLEKAGFKCNIDNSSLDAYKDDFVTSFFDTKSDSSLSVNSFDTEKQIVDWANHSIELSKKYQ